MARGKILIAEDDRKTAALIALYLERDGFETLVAHDGIVALETAMRNPIVLVILDLMLPRMDGWTLCQELRRTSNVPILMLSARGEPHERILGLKLGADDYVVKPFSPAEVLVRVNTILRRGSPSDARAQYSHDGLVLDLTKRRVTLHGRDVSLTPSEFKLLRALMMAPGRTFARDELLNHLYATSSAVVDRAIDVHVGKLRQKIEVDPARPRHVLTVRGMGYKFADASDDDKDAGTP